MQAVRHLLAGLLIALGVTASATAAPTGTLTVYTSQPSDQIAKVVDAFKKLYPDVKIELFRSGTTEVMNKLQAEAAAGRPQADVVLIADAVAITQLKNDGRLLAFPEAPADKVPPALVDPDMTFFGTKLITTGIVINTKLVPTAPKSWKDLLAPQAAAKTILADPLYSGAAVIHVGTMVQQPEFGWSLFRNAGEERRDCRQGQRRRDRGGSARRKSLRRHHRIHGLQRQEQRLAGGLRVPAGGRVGDHSAGGHSQDQPQCRGGQSLRGLAVVRRGAAPVGGARLFPGLRLLSIRPRAIRRYRRSRSCRRI